jgi:hypothetical protein
LSSSKLPNGLPQLVEALRHLLHLLRVDGSGWRRRDRLWGGLRNRCRLLGLLHRLSSSIFRTGQRLRPACDRLLDLRRPAEFRGPCGDYLLGIPAISLPSQGASDANANRDQETNERSQGRYLKGSAEFDARIGLYLSFNNVASGVYTGGGVWSANINARHMTRAMSEIHIMAAPTDRRGGAVCRICSDIWLIWGQV